jgi:hypothetical protein
LTAWILTIWSNFVCKSIKFEPVGGKLPTLRFGIWNYLGKAIYSDYYGNTWVADACHAFPGSVDLDAKWKTAQAFSIMAFVFGCVSICIVCMVPPKMMKVAAVYYLMVAFFQGLTMIQLASDFCDNNDVVSGITGANNAPLYKDSCEMDVGFQLNISATVLYFCAGIACLFILPEDTPDCCFGGETEDGQPDEEGTRADGEEEEPKGVEDEKASGDEGAVEKDEEGQEREEVEQGEDPEKNE